MVSTPLPSCPAAPDTRALPEHVRVGNGPDTPDHTTRVARQTGRIPQRVDATTPQIAEAADAPGNAASRAEVLARLRQPVLPRPLPNQAADLPGRARQRAERAQRRAQASPTRRQGSGRQAACGAQAHHEERVK